MQFHPSSLDRWSYCHRGEAALPSHCKLPHTTALRVHMQPTPAQESRRAFKSVPEESNTELYIFSDIIDLFKVINRIIKHQTHKMSQIRFK